MHICMCTSCSTFRGLDLRIKILEASCAVNPFRFTLLQNFMHCCLLSLRLYVLSLQIGDVVLVQDESVMTDCKMVELETLVYSFL